MRSNWNCTPFQEFWRLLIFEEPENKWGPSNIRNSSELDYLNEGGIWIPGRTLHPESNLSSQNTHILSLALPFSTAAICSSCSHHLTKFPYLPSCASSCSPTSKSSKSSSFGFSKSSQEDPDSRGLAITHNGFFLSAITCCMLSATAPSLNPTDLERNDILPEFVAGPGLACTEK